MDTLGERLRYALKTQGMTQTELADSVGVKQQSIQNLCSGKSTKSRFIYEIAQALHINLEWLSTGQGPMRPLELEMQASSTPNPKRVPLIDWQQVPSWAEQLRSGLASPIKDWVYANQAVSSSAFALIIEGQSMESPTAPSFPHGYKIIVDPDRNAQHNDFVIVSLSSDELPKLRQVLIEGKQRFYKVLNPDFPDRVSKASAKACEYGVVAEIQHQF